MAYQSVNPYDGKKLKVRVIGCGVCRRRFPHSMERVRFIIGRLKNGASFG
jgi:hypothetical protein